MKTLLTPILATLFFFSTQYARAQSCCQKPAGNSMQALALNMEFKAAHEAPLPLNYVAQKGEMTKVPTSGGPDANAFFIPADVPSDRVLIVVHEWWGLNDYIKREAEKWQQLLGGKVAVYAIDLYDGKVAATPDEAGKIMSTLTPARGEAIINGVLADIGKDKKIATIGWCMGGSWSFTATLLAGNEAAGCVMYYGFPEKDANRIKQQLKADVLYIRATQDGFIKEPDVIALGANVDAAKHAFTLHKFDAVHAFANPSNPKYDAKAAAEAQEISLKFLKEKLKLD